MKTAIIALGSNLDNPTKQVLSAIQEISDHPRIKLLAQSNLHLTKPVGYLEQPDFINAVIKIQTNLSPLNLLRFLQTLEQLHQRVRTIKYGPRTLDLDLIVYEGFVSNTDKLTLPHPRAHERSFVMDPWREIIDPEIAL